MLKRAYENCSFGISIEVFPPKTPQGDESLYRALENLQAYRPKFISCTYGAGGSTQGRTLEICRTIQERIGVPTTAHLTCVGTTREGLTEWLTSAQDHGVLNIMALRGDAPQGQSHIQFSESGPRFAHELVTLIRSQFPDMGIGVAGYPEKHPEAPSLEIDIARLKAKVDAGADAIYTQLFFINDHFLHFREQAERRGVQVPIIPGIMPITEFTRIKRIVSLCGAEIPKQLASRLEAVQDDLDAQFEIGVEHAIEQCHALRNNGARGIHFYALNKSTACERILQSLVGTAVPAKG